MLYLRVNDHSLLARDAIAYQSVFQFAGGFEEQCIRILLAREYATRHKICVDAAGVESLIVEWRYANGLERGDVFRRYLADHATPPESLSDLMEHIETEKAIRARISADDVSRYYAENRQIFDRAELISITSDNIELLHEIKCLVVEDGDSMQGFAATYSTSPTARQGGYLGWRRRAELSGESEAAIFSASVGSVVGPFKLDGDRFELNQVLALELPSFEQVGPQIRDVLLEQLYRRLKLEAHIEFFPGE